MRIHHFRWRKKQGKNHDFDMAYKLTGKKSKAGFILHYENGLMTRFELIQAQNWTEPQRKFICVSILPLIISDEAFLKSKDIQEYFKVDELPENLTFQDFWDLFGNKVGKKAKAEQLWKLLPEAEKREAIIGIKRYKNWLIQNPNVQMLYPETFLSQKRWENEY